MKQGPTPETPLGLAAQVGVRVRQKRLEIVPRVSQVELARRASLSRPAVAAIEAGQQGMALSTLYRVARALSCEVGDLLPPLSEVAVSSVSNLDEALDTFLREAQR